MKKRFFCLAVCIIMCMNIIGCSSEEKKAAETTAPADGVVAVTDVSANKPMTLTLWLPTDETTTPEAVALVEKEINRITQNTYNTAVKLYALSDSEYEALLEMKFGKLNADYEIDEELINSTKYTAEAPFEQDMRSPVSQRDDTPEYPKVTADNIDIVLVRGYSNYLKYINGNMLSSLNESLNNNSKILKTYISPQFFEAANYFGDTYAIPNNHVIGEYTYLLFNKKVADDKALSRDYNDIEKRSIESIFNNYFVQDVAKHYPNITPVLNTIPPADCSYLNADGSNKFSLISFSATNGFVSTLANPESEYNKAVIYMKRLADAGYVATNPDSVTEFGLGMVQGSVYDIQEYAENYYIYEYDQPKGTLENMYEAMLSVSTYTKDIGRSMEIITAINTNSELRTILQYGVEGVNWKHDIDNDKIIREIVDPEGKLVYKMNITETGNTFITYPDFGVPVSYWDDGIAQNLDAEISPILQFTGYVNEENTELFDQLTTLSADYKTRIDAMTADEYRDSVLTLNSDWERSEAFKQLLYVATDDDTTGYSEKASVVMQLNSFYADFYS